jgi:hypothetical protein
MASVDLTVVILRECLILLVFWSIYLFNFKWHLPTNLQNQTHE